METVISQTKLASLPDVEKRIRDFATEEEQRLTALCFSIFDYEKEKIDLGDPTPEEEKQFIRVLKELKSTVQQAQSAYPTANLEWLVDRIEFSLASLENPMSQEEADEFLDKHFPG
jgi:uncharacterized protein YifE (UPF0438 family)